ncbi:unnamed protein product [Boreogadus saida]
MTHTKKVPGDVHDAAAQIDCAPSQSQAARDTARLLLHVARLGLTVNFVKSRLYPSQRVTYLGMVLDSDAMRAYLSLRRVTDILL